MTAALILAALVAAVAVVAVALPFLREPALRREGDRLDDPDALEQRQLALAEERDRALAALKELEFDHRTGKLSDEDYAELVGPLRRSAAETLAALEPRAGVRASLYRIRDMSEPLPPPVTPPGPVTVPEPSPVPHEPPQPPSIPEPSPVPSTPPEQPRIPEPTPAPPEVDYTQ